LVPSGGSNDGGRSKPIERVDENCGNWLAGRMLDVVTNVCAYFWLCESPPLSVNDVVPNGPPTPLKGGSVATAASYAAMMLIQAPR